MNKLTIGKEMLTGRTEIVVGIHVMHFNIVNAIVIPD